MTAPQLTAYQQGLGAVNADGLNTFEQTCDVLAQLRAITGLPGMQVYVRGSVAVADGGQGQFYWNTTATGADNGTTIIRPTGSIGGTPGAWIRISDVFGDFLNVLDFGADPSGAADSSAAFQAAANAAGTFISTIIVPAGTYLINTAPTWTKSLIWWVDPNASFTGAGAADFPRAATNSAEMAVGPFIQSRSTANNTVSQGIGAAVIEYLQPAGAVNNGVGLYVGADTSAPNGYLWACNFLVTANAGSTKIIQGIETDCNNFSGGSATVVGNSIIISGSSDGTKGLQVQSAAANLGVNTAWQSGIEISGSRFGHVILANAFGSNLKTLICGITFAPINTTITYITSGRTTMMFGQQYDNGDDCLLFARNTDTSPTGDFIRLVNQAGTANLFLVDINGNVSSDGYIQTNVVGVAGLPTPTTNLRGARLFVSDSTVAASGNFGAVVVGSGANFVPVFCDGVNWRIG
jgi:hypothetical protein